MGVRHERVVLTLQDNFSSEMARAAAATALLDRNLDSLSGSAVRTRAPVRATAIEVETLDKSVRRANPDLNQFTGRLRIAADAAAVLGPALVPIGAVAVPALAGLTAQLGFAAVGMGSLVVASQGVGDALKAVNDAALDPTAENLEKASEAMRRLGPDAQAFVARFQELRPTLTMIRDAAAAGWFPGLTESLDSFEQAAPRVASLMETIGRTGGGLVAEGVAALTGDDWREFWQFAEDNAPEALEDLGRTVGNLTRGVAELVMAFDPLSDDFGDFLLKSSGGFAEWAEGLEDTQGFEEFLEYVETNGPRVQDTFVAVADAAVEVVEALAPLGGPSLQIIESFAKAVGAIADSDLGTPILAGAAALAIYNRALQVTTALQTRLGLSGAAAAGTGPSGAAAGGFLGGFLGGPGARGGLRQATADLRTYGALRTQVLARTAAETQRMNTALASSRANFAATARGATPAAVALGALGAAATSTEQSIVGTNMAMGALIGSLGGPWGAAAGAALGNLLDLKAGYDAVNEAISGGDARAARDAFEERTSFGVMDLISQKRLVTQGLGDLYSKITTGETQTSKLLKAGAYEKLEGNFSSLEEMQAYRENLATASRDAEGAELGLSRAMIRTADAAGLSNLEMAQGIAAIEARTDAAMGAFDAETNWRQALKAANQQAATNNAGIRGSSQAALENRAALGTLAAAWKGQRDAMEAAGASTQEVNGRFRQSRKAFIDTAVAMGVPIGQARRLANQLLAIPTNRKTKVTAETGGAMTQLNRVKAAIDALYDKTVTITTVRQAAGLAKQADVVDARPKYLGGYTGDGGKYEPAGIVHRGEVVIPQELVARDRDLLRSRYGHLPGMDQLYTGGLAGYAQGGRVGALDFAGLPALNLATAGFNALSHALRDSERALKREKSQREQLVSQMGSLRSEVTTNLRSEIFGDPGVWSGGSDFTNVMGALRGDIATGTAFRADVAALRRKGLDGGALDELLRHGSTTTVDQWSRLTRAQLAQFERVFERRQTITAGAGAAAGQAAYGNRIRIEDKQIRRIERRLGEIKSTLKHEHREDRRAARRGAGRTARRRHRGKI